MTDGVGAWTVGKRVHMTSKIFQLKTFIITLNANNDDGRYRSTKSSSAGVRSSIRWCNIIEC